MVGEIQQNMLTNGIDVHAVCRKEIKFYKLVKEIWIQLCSGYNQYIEKIFYIAMYEYVFGYTEQQSIW